MNRRHFLKQSLTASGAALFAASPLQIFLSQVLSGFINRSALAEDAYFSKAKNFTILMGGGPPRHLFDGILRPNGNESSFSMGPNNLLGTHVDVNQNNLITHKFQEFMGIHLPYLWSGKIPTSGGGSVDMTELAKHFCGIRGLQSIDDHAQGMDRQFVSSLGGYSLSGSFADQSPHPFPAVGLGLNPKNHFKSKSGRPFTGVSDLSALFGTFNISADKFLTNNTKNYGIRMNSSSTEEAIDQALVVLQSQSKVLKGRVPTTYQQRLIAKKLMKQDFSNVSETYEILLLKYKNLIYRSFNDPALRLEGADKLPIAGSKINSFEMAMHGHPKSYYTGKNLELEMLGEAITIPNLAEGMAIAEFMLTNGTDLGYTSSMDLIIGSAVTNSIISSISLSESPQSNYPTSLITDVHEIGSIFSIFFFSRYYRAIAACIHELCSVLKNASVPGTTNDKLLNWASIGLTSEFGRSATQNYNGMGHGASGGVYSIFSGKINGPMILGNIKTQGSLNSNVTWGEGAPIPALSNQRITPGHVHSTIASLF